MIYLVVGIGQLGKAYQTNKLRLWLICKRSILWQLFDIVVRF